jgi:hypothetical protein
MDDAQNVKKEIPGKIVSLSLEEWYSPLSERETVILNRYLKYADDSSISGFFRSLAEAALKDDNPSFAVTVCESALDTDGADPYMSRIERFDITELLIEAYIGVKRYDEAKVLCERDLKMFPSVHSVICERNDGKIPEKLNCRNRYVDIVVGIESGYDEAFALLDRFFEMGLITKEDLALRVQSLRIRRLQRSFDGVFTYSYKD